MSQLIAGANLILSTPQQPTPTITLQFSYGLRTGELDVSTYLLTEKTAKVRGDADMIFYGQKSTPNRSVVLDFTGDCSVLRIKTALIDADIHKLAICATIDKADNFSVMQSLDFDLKNADGETIATASETGQNRTEAALILAEVYRHKGNWKCRWVMQGFRDFHLQQLAEFYGVEVEKEAPPAAPPPPPISFPEPPKNAPDELPPPPSVISF